MKFSIIAYETDDALAARRDPARRGAYWGAYGAYVQALRQAGVMAGGAGLEPPATAATVRLRDGHRQVQDGPFADTKERLAGFFVVDVPDMDAALEWAARCPAAALGAVEVRPHLPEQAAPGAA